MPRHYEIPRNFRTYLDDHVTAVERTTEGLTLTSGEMTSVLGVDVLGDWHRGWAALALLVGTAPPPLSTALAQFWEDESARIWCEVVGNLVDRASTS